MPKIVLLFILFTLTSAHAQKKLHFEKILFNRDDTEISGLLTKDNELLFVADKLSNRAIYKVRFENDRFFYTNYIDISKLAGHNSYFAKALFFKHGGRIVKSPFDLEGLAFCNGNFYLANEQARHILKVTQQKIDFLPLDFSKIFKKINISLEKIPTNAGFEGIAIDCKKQILYIAQERQPRAILVVDLKSKKAIDIFQTDKEKRSTLTPDYSDLYFENNYLYLLERNDHIITKLDVKTRKVIAKVSFGHTDKLHLKKIYDTGEPYGLAEGLTMNEKQIFVAIDNNKKPLSKEAQKEFNTKGNVSSIIIYTRPKGF